MPEPGSLAPEFTLVPDLPETLQYTVADRLFIGAGIFVFDRGERHSPDRSALVPLDRIVLERPGRGSGGTGGGRPRRHREEPAGHTALLRWLSGRRPTTLAAFRRASGLQARIVKSMRLPFAYLALCSGSSGRGAHVLNDLDSSRMAQRR